jgi:hypothetical protein
MSESKRRVKRIGTRRGEMPLQYLLKLMRDETADDARRDKAAIAALPYCSARLATHYLDRDARAALAAKAASRDVEWADDLRTEVINLRPMLEN